MTHGEQSVSGLTIKNWLKFIEESRGREAAERIMAGLSPAARAEFGEAVIQARNYSQGAFADFCESVRRACGGWAVGLSMGEHNAVESQRVIGPILKSAKGDAMYFLKKRLLSIHRLYVDKGTLWFEESGPAEGILFLQGFTHTELLCHSIAGYSRKCLDLIGVRGAQVVEVRHSPDAMREPCRIPMRWTPGA